MIITVAIVEDSDHIREGLAVLISGSAGFKCIGSFASAEDAVRKLPALKPDVVLMDIHLPGMSGIECLGPLKESLTNTQVMMLTVYEDDDQIFKSLAAGATGYILKTTPPAELLDAIRTIHNGGSPMSDRIARRVVETFRIAGTSSRETENLTDRESEVLAYVARGYRDKELAEMLFLSVDTVRTHLRNIYRKLHVRTRTEAALKYLKKSRSPD
jgi:DNA-binding NarL/FixJ family response regulator